MGKSDLQYVTFELCGQTYGAPVEDVLEVIRMVGMSESPEALPYVLGLINVRGHVVPVVDMRARLHLARAEYTLETPIMLTRHGDITVGLVIDRVLEVAMIPDAAIDAPDGTFSSSHCVTGVAKAGAKLIFLLNLESVLTADDAQLLQELSSHGLHSGAPA